MSGVGAGGLQGRALQLTAVVYERKVCCVVAAVHALATPRRNSTHWHLRANHTLIEEAVRCIQAQLTCNATKSPKMEAPIVTNTPPPCAQRRTRQAALPTLSGIHHISEGLHNTYLRRRDSRLSRQSYLQRRPGTYHLEGWSQTRPAHTATGQCLQVPSPRRAARSQHRLAVDAVAQRHVRHGPDQLGRRMMTAAPLPTFAIDINPHMYPPAQLVRRTRLGQTPAPRSPLSVMVI